MIKIYRGQTKGFSLKLRGQKSGDPLDLTGATEIVVSLPLETPGGTYLDKKLSLSQLSTGTDAKLGMITVSPDLTAAETLTLNPSLVQQKVLAKVVKGTDIKYYTAEILEVIDP